MIGFLLVPKQGLPFGSLLFLKDWFLKPAPPGSAARVLSAGAQRRSAPKVPQGFLRICLMAGSAGFREVPRRFRRKEKT